MVMIRVAWASSLLQNSPRVSSVVASVHGIGVLVACPCMTSVLTLSSVKGRGALAALRGHPLLGPRTLGCGYKSRRVILWTDGSEPGARRGAPLYADTRVSTQGSARAARMAPGGQRQNHASMIGDFFTELEPELWESATTWHCRLNDARAGGGSSSSGVLGHCEGALLLPKVTFCTSCRQATRQAPKSLWSYCLRQHSGRMAQLRSSTLERDVQLL